MVIMFVILETGSKQYRVSEGNTIQVEKIDAKEGDTIILDNILLLQNDDGETLIGKPNIKSVKVEAEVVKHFKDDKVIIFKKRRRHNSKRKNGHRQQKTELKILKIKA